MTDMKRRSLIGALAAAPFVVPLLTRAQTPDAHPKFKQIPSRERIRQRYFPNLVLTTHEGNKVKSYDDLVKDKIVIFNMFYAKCEGICSPITRNLVRLQNILGERVGKDIFMYSFTLKPKEDNVDALLVPGGTLHEPQRDVEPTDPAQQPERRLDEGETLPASSNHGTLLHRVRAAKDDAVRRHAVRLCEGRLPGSDEMLVALVKRVEDPDVTVRFQLAFTLGQWADVRAGRMLGRLLRNDGNDRWVRTACMR